MGTTGRCRHRNNMLTNNRHGVADEELAKREAERAKRRRRDSISSGGSGSGSDSESSLVQRGAKGTQPSRRRSPSHSGTDPRSPSRSPSRSVSPPRKAIAVTAEPGPYDASRSQRDRSGSAGASKSRSASPPLRRGVERSRSPVARDNRMKSTDFFGGAAAAGDLNIHRSQRDQDRDRNRHRHSSRSPGRGSRHQRRYRERDGERSGRHHDHDRQSRSKHDDREYSRRPSPPAEQDAGVDRERSLSPFSRRLALTKEMHSGKQA